MTKVLEISQFEKLIEGLAKSPEIAVPLVAEAMHLSLAQIHDAVAVSPPATDANRPGRLDARGRAMGYYQRGSGWWYPVYKKQLEGKGKKRLGLIRNNNVMYKLRRSSERLNTKWTSRVTVDKAAVLGEIGNTASYADWVQGFRQADFHDQRGWQTIEDAVNQVYPDIEKNFEEATRKFIEQIIKD